MIPDPTRTDSAVGPTFVAAEPPSPLDTRPLSPPAAPPTDVNAPPGFVIQMKLGDGGSAVVYLARQAGLNRLVALKLMKGGDAVEPKTLIRFLAEAEAVAAVRHPNVVEVYQFGEQGGKPYLALEYCPSGDLTSLSKSRPIRDVAWFRRVAGLMAKVSDGVQAAHALGIVHRDLKPANILLADEETPKVADFGLAKRGVGSDLTNTQAVMGTPAYMAPEQAGGGTRFVGPEADVWALGVVLFELACGERPIDTTGPFLDALARVANPTLPDLRSRCPAVPKDFARIIHKALSPDRRDRYPTAGGLATDLRNWLDGKPISARSPGLVETTFKWARRNKTLAGMGLAVLITMAVATGVSVGFGLDADGQRKQAVGAAARADEKATDAEREKNDAISARNDLAREKEQTQRTLAKALLGPMRDVGLGRGQVSGLTEFEFDALWELAADRREPVGLMLYDEATRTRQGATQLRCRAAHMDHAVVGLDSARRRQVDALVGERLRDPAVPAVAKREIAVTAVTIGRFSDPDTIAETLLAALGTGFNPHMEDAYAASLLAAARQLPPERAARLLSAALERPTYPYLLRSLAEGLGEVAGTLPGDQAAQVCRKAAAQLVVALGRSPENPRGGPVGGTATGLAAVARWLPADEAARVCDPLPELLLVVLGARVDAPQEVVAGVLAVGDRLAADRRNKLFGQASEKLLQLVSEPANRFSVPEYSPGLVQLAERLPGEKAVIAYTAAADAAVAYFTTLDPMFLQSKQVTALFRMTSRLPTADARRLTAAAVEFTRRAVAAKPLPVELGELISALAGILPPDQAERMLAVAADKLLATVEAEAEAVGQNPKIRLGMNTYNASTLAIVACRLPTDWAERVCEKGVAAVAAAEAKTMAEPEWGHNENGSASLAAGLPLARVEQLCGPPEVTLSRFPVVTSGHDQRALSDAFAAMVWRCRPVDQRLLALPAAAGGVVATAPLPRPAPLPPQQLVDLLKHPMAVNELRRTLLDALEFTYDRKFVDLWEFVAFAEKEHPELDLLTPPKRPEKK